MNEYNYSISQLIGKTITKIDKTEDTLIFYTKEGKNYLMAHERDCCEEVTIDDICGDLDDLLDSPILIAEENTNKSDSECADSFTWTFYKLATIKGYVDIKWFGTSNGYYSETVEVTLIEDEEEEKFDIVKL